MIQQAKGWKHNPSLMLIDDADRPAKWYFALKQAGASGDRRWDIRRILCRRILCLGR